MSRSRANRLQQTDLGLSGLAPLPHIWKVFFTSLRYEVYAYKFTFELTILWWVKKGWCVHIVSFCNLIGTATARCQSQQLFLQMLRGSLLPLPHPVFRRDPGDEPSVIPLRRTKAWDRSLDTQGISKINSVYRNLKHQMKLDLCICEALSYTSVPWKPYLWAWLSITTNIN